MERIIDGLRVEAVWVDTAAAALRYRDAGYEPMECSFGSSGGSVLGPLRMDHHGDLSHQGSVARRAYLGYFGALRESPLFVGTGRPDADVTFGGAALLGVLPEPGGQHGVMALMELIHRIDIDPIGIRLAKEPWGPHHRWWSQQQSHRAGAEGFLHGVANWIRVCRDEVPQQELDAVMRKEASRLAKAASAEFIRVSEYVTVVISTVSGWPVWYEQHTPVIVVTNPEHPGKATVGCRNVKVAERLFGSDGLKNIYPDLQPQGWGGREAIGASPRDAFLELRDVILAAHVIAGKVHQFPRTSGEDER